jgi:hypothetical protein
VRGTLQLQEDLSDHTADWDAEELPFEPDVNGVLSRVWRSSNGVVGASPVEEVTRAVLYRPHGGLREVIEDNHRSLDHFFAAVRREAWVSYNVAAILLLEARVTYDLAQEQTGRGAALTRAEWEEWAARRYGVELVTLLDLMVMETVVETLDVLNAGARANAGTRSMPAPPPSAAPLIDPSELF